MNESAQPSILSAFVKGAGSGIFSGGLMMSILGALSLIPGVALAPALPVALMIVGATGLFGGIMATKRILFDEPAAAREAGETVMPIPTGAAGVAMAPTLAAEADEPSAAQDAPTKNWAASTGRSDGAQSRIQQILDNGSLSDKDRASAILAAREASSAENGASIA